MLFIIENIYGLMSKIGINLVKFVIGWVCKELINWIRLEVLVVWSIYIVVGCCSIRILVLFFKVLF